MMQNDSGATPKRDELKQALQAMPPQVRESYQRLHTAATREYEIVGPSPALLNRLAIVEREIAAGRNPWPAGED